MRLAVHEEGSREVLKPRSRRRRRVADEVRTEVAVPDQPQRGCGSDCRAGLLHPGFVSAPSSALRVEQLEAAARRAQPGGELVVERVDLRTQLDEPELEHALA